MKNARYGIILLCLIVLGCSPKITNLDAKGSTIVCFGDSLTEGVGAGQDADYPFVLSKMVSAPVINAGVGGDTTGDALKRIERDVLAHKPRMVIVMLGGNDFLRKLSLKTAHENMEEIVKRIQDNGAIVVIAAVKLGLLQDTMSKGFKEIADERGALFIPNVMKGILADPKLKYDQIHPNADGYKLIAERIYQAIEPLL